MPKNAQSRPSAAGNFHDTITFAEIDYDQFDGKETLNIQVVPTFIGYKNGKQVLRFTGIRSQEQLQSDLHRLLDMNNYFF